jgi:hypothetical protein
MVKHSNLIGRHDPLDGITDPEYKVVAFHTTNYFFAKRRRHWLLTGIGAAI